MFYKLLAFGLFFLAFDSCIISPQGKEINISWQDSLSIEDNIAKNAVILQGSNDLYFLDKIAKDRSVIMLGEAGHGDSISTNVKIQILSYLFDKGFRSVAFEGYPFLSCYVLSNKKFNSMTKDWTYDMKGQEVFQGIQYFSNKNLKVWGIDVYGGFYDVDAAKIILNKYIEKYNFLIDWNKLKNYYNRKFINIEKLDSNHFPSVSEQVELGRMIDSISNFTRYLIYKEGKNNDLSAILQWIRNVNTNYSVNKLFEDEVDIFCNTEKTTLPFRNRDTQMAENILWITEHYTNEKFTVWTANYHAVKDISQTLFPSDSLMYFIHQCAAEGVYNKLGDKFYSLAFTSFNYRNNKDNEGLLESSIAKETKNASFAFIDFERLRFEDGYRDKEFESSIIKKKKGKWLYMFDGIYYTRDEYLFKEFEKYEK